MILFKKSGDLGKWVETQQKKGETIGFVPTMGALHAGHLSLVDRSKKENDHTVCSIFINPTQFNDPRDFEKYPVTFEKDITLLLTSGASVLFLPSVKEIYPQGEKSFKNYELGYLDEILEGKYRPGHFQGVCMVVEKLLDIVHPDKLYLGQKDYQQCLVLVKLVSQLQLSPLPEVIVCPTLRENDGLAMSSRNARLKPIERMKAPSIFKALTFIKVNLHPGPMEGLKEQAGKFLENEGFRVDYIEIADMDDLKSITVWDGKQKAVALVAAFLGEIRLIDNLILGRSHE